MAKEYFLPPGFHTFGKGHMGSGDIDYGWSHPSVDRSRIEQTLGPLASNWDRDTSNFSPGIVIFKDGAGRLCLYGVHTFQGVDSTYRPYHEGGFLIVGESDGKMTPLQQAAFLRNFGGLDLSQIPDLNTTTENKFALLLERKNHSKLEKQLPISSEWKVLEQDVASKLDSGKQQQLFSQAGHWIGGKSPENIVALYQLLNSDQMKQIQNGEVVAVITAQNKAYIEAHSKTSEKEAIYPDAKWVLALKEDYKDKLV